MFLIPKMAIDSVQHSISNSPKTAVSQARKNQQAYPSHHNLYLGIPSGQPALERRSGAQPLGETIRNRPNGQFEPIGAPSVSTQHVMPYWACEPIGAPSVTTAYDLCQQLRCSSWRRSTRRHPPRLSASSSKHSPCEFSASF